MSNPCMIHQIFQNTNFVYLIDTSFKFKMYPRRIYSRCALGQRGCERTLPSLPPSPLPQILLPTYTNNFKSMQIFAKNCYTGSKPWICLAFTLLILAPHCRATIWKSAYGSAVMSNAQSYDGPNGSLFISILLHNSEF